MHGLRRFSRLLIGSAVVFSLLLTLTGTPPANAQGTGKAIPPFPSSPIALQILDVAGQKQLVKAMIDNYVKANPDKVSSVSWVTDVGYNMAGRLQAQENSGKIDTDMVLTGLDGLSAGITQHLLLQITPDYSAKFPNLADNYLPAAKPLSALAQGFGVLDVYTPSGPLIEYDPSQVDTPPATIDDLKSWIAANPNKFTYARPAGSGPGRTFLMGLPYILGDKNPKDPVNGWDKTWAWLKDIDQYIDYYTATTGNVMGELGNGTRAMTLTTMGWDLNPRILGTVPKEDKVTWLKGAHWVADEQFVVIPKGLSDDHLAVVLDLIAWMLKPEQQALSYDSGYFYPGPAVKDVPLSMAPADIQQHIKDYGRPEYDDLIKNNPIEVPLSAPCLVYAFARWDREIGQNKTKLPPTPTLKPGDVATAAPTSISTAATTAPPSCQ